MCVRGAHHLVRSVVSPPELGPSSCTMKRAYQIERQVVLVSVELLYRDPMLVLNTPLRKIISTRPASSMHITCLRGSSLPHVPQCQKTSSEVQAQAAGPVRPAHGARLDLPISDMRSLFRTLAPVSVRSLVLCLLVFKGSGHALLIVWLPRSLHLSLRSGYAPSSVAPD